jgi:eukaryotic-like serine/threonine-protein kinase
VQEKTVKTASKTMTDEDQFLAGRRVDLARTLVHVGELATAERLLEQSRAGLEKKLVADSSHLAPAALVRGELLLARKQPAQAVEVLEKALALASPRLRPQVALALAEAYQQSGREQTRALELAREALSFYQQTGNALKRAEVERWLARHTAGALPGRAP